MEPKRTPPPSIPRVQLGLRFLLEIGALVSLGTWARGLATGWQSWAFGIGVPLAAVIAWGTFAVPDDPSRSGKAPVRVPGVVRLVLELVVFFGGAAALAATGRHVIAAVFGAAILLHHALTVPRLRWLVAQK